MRIHCPKLRNMAHALSYYVFIAFKGTKFYIFICIFSYLYAYSFQDCTAYGITGHVTRMPNERLQKKVLYGELQEGKHSQGGQKNCYKDTLKASMKDLNIATESWKQTTLMILNLWTDMSGQTVQTQIRLLLEEQSDKGLHCLLINLHLFDEIP